MKIWICIALIICSATALPGTALWGGGEERVTIVIRPDGTAAATNATVQPRAVAEQMARLWLRYLKSTESDAEESPAAPSEPDNKPMTDEELRLAVVEGTKVTAEQTGLERRIEQIHITSNELRTVWSQQYTTLSEFAGQAQAVLSQAGLMPANVRLETTNNQLQITLFASPQRSRYSQSMRARWKATQSKAELTWMLPGQVSSSTLPDVSGNTTSIRVTSDDEKSIDAFIKASEGNITITSELNGLKLDTAVESKSFQAARLGQHETGGNVPITEAGPGFVAEAVSVTTSTLTLFPEGEKVFKAATGQRFETGTVVRAKLFPPKGRSIISANDLQVTKVLDDQGRSIPSEGDAEAQLRRNFRSFSRDDDENSPAVDIELKLGLPAADAEAIAELVGQAVVVTVGNWKEFAVTNLQANATNTFDLGSILPGAKLALRKVTQRKQQVTVELQLSGPAAVADLQVQCKQPGSTEVHSYSTNRRSTSTPSQTTRLIQLQCSNYSEDTLNPANLVLFVRAPDDLRREKVSLKLTNLDLL